MQGSLLDLNRALGKQNTTRSYCKNCCKILVSAIVNDDGTEFCSFDCMEAYSNNQSNVARDKLIATQRELERWQCKYDDMVKLKNVFERNNLELQKKVQKLEEERLKDQSELLRCQIKLKNIRDNLND